MNEPSEAHASQEQLERLKDANSSELNQQAFNTHITQSYYLNDSGVHDPAQAALNFTESSQFGAAN
jgi:hypothetical protein